MPLDGIVVHCLVDEFKNNLIDSKIDKIYQPEKDELVFLVRGLGKSRRLLLSASPNNPRVHFTDINKSNPDVPPMFCMLLRKHLVGGIIIDILQPDFERIIEIHIESYNELGDLTVKKLFIEIMGRHSNIILTDIDNRIIDCIKHIDLTVSSVRQVLPGLTYVSPPSQGKLNPLEISAEDIQRAITQQGDSVKIDKAIMNSFTGISPLIAREICHEALGNSDAYVGELAPKDISALVQRTYSLIDSIKGNKFHPVLLYDKAQNKAFDFSAVDILQYHHSEYSFLEMQEKNSVSEVLDDFYAMRDNQDRLKQKSTDLIKVVHNNLERCKKKLDIQQHKMGEVQNRDKLKIFGDLITANIYQISQGMDAVTAENFYDELLPTVTIPLDPNLSPAKNAQKYFNEYTKAKNAAKMVTEQIEYNIQEIEYLESTSDAISRAENEKDLNEIREELVEQGYLRKRTVKKLKKQSSLSSPMHFVSSDGFEILVGKNNKQNDYLTLKIARSSDIWFHTKTIPGSHTVIKTENRQEIPPSTLMEAAMLAAYHSKGKSSSNVAVDYTAIKNVKKPNGAKPGMVIYENFKTIYVTPKEEIVEKLRK